LSFSLFHFDGWSEKHFLLWFDAKMNQAGIALPYSYCLSKRRVIMEQHQIKPQVAQPADEEIKKHGDQLAKQVQDAAGKKREEQHLEKDNSPKE
jgi:hypothetical protein